jgi:putative tricarboxylic transport membrane protein
MKGKDKGEFVIPIILIALSIFLYANTYTFKFETYPKASPQIWPRSILVLLILTSLILIFKLSFEMVKEQQQKPKIMWGMMLQGISILFLYIFSMEYLGYILSTLGFTFLAMLMLGNKRKLQLVVVPLMSTLLIFLLFTYGMFIPLPKGVWIFRTFSLLFQY